MVQKFFRKEAVRELSGYGYTEFHEAIRMAAFPSLMVTLGHALRSGQSKPSQIGKA